ncbi:hypothetical protein NDU88_001313 [Pleurodeles waltl]|uniref:Endonuclease/exonuclease/phosphatase domain-containing protein n=1 Tax=Pleurodeles waltl TaxID=8319 RepID=A0AAV7Q6Q2_PLEWA|nr:hypothetical protein NDU88_001313 [Pleurodeles waltl]
MHNGEGQHKRIVLESGRDVSENLRMPPLEYLKMFDIIVVQETWALSSKPLIGFVDYSRFAHNSSISWRAKGRLAVYVSSNLTAKVTVMDIQEPWLLALHLDGWSLQMVDPLSLVNIYIGPREKSMMVGKLINYLQELKRDCMAANLLLTGDFSSNLLQPPAENHNDEHGAMLDQSYPHYRRQDKIGKKLLRAYELAGLIVLNGRLLGDTPPTWFLTLTFPWQTIHCTTSDHQPQTIWVRVNINMNSLGPARILQEDEHSESPKCLKCNSDTVHDLAVVAVEIFEPAKTFESNPIEAWEWFSEFLVAKYLDKRSHKSASINLGHS